MLGERAARSIDCCLRSGNRSKVVLCCAAVLGGIAFASATAAQTYPSKPVRVIVSTAPGGASDFILRPVIQKVSESLKQPFVVDNRAGANGIIAMELTAKAAADGYTLLFGTAGSHVTNVAIHEKLPFDVIKDFSPITKFVNTPFLLSVHPSVPAVSVQEFVALAKANPGKITYASYGVASFSHLLAEWFSLVAGVKMVHVPYKGSAPAIAALIAGQVQSEFDSMPSSMPHVRGNRLRALAIGSPKRSAVAPEIPTFAEAGLPGFAASTWFGLFAPANTPRPIVMQLHAEIVKALAIPEIRNRLESVGAEPAGNTPDQFTAQIRSDIDRYVKVAREANIRAE